MLITDILEGLTTELYYTGHDSYISLSRGPSERTLSRWTVNLYGSCAGNAYWPLEIHSLPSSLCTVSCESGLWEMSQKSPLLSGFWLDSSNEGILKRDQRMEKHEVLKFVSLDPLIRVTMSGSQSSTKDTTPLRGPSFNQEHSSPSRDLPSTKDKAPLRRLSFSTQLSHSLDSSDGPSENKNNHGSTVIILEYWSSLLLFSRAAHLF